MDLPTLGTQLRARRTQLGRSQASVARAVDCTPQFISFLETQEPTGNPNAALLLRIVDALELDLSLQPREANDAAAILLTAARSLSPSDLSLLLRFAAALPGVDPTVKEAHARAFEAMAGISATLSSRGTP